MQCRGKENPEVICKFTSWMHYILLKNLRGMGDRGITHHQKMVETTFRFIKRILSTLQTELNIVNIHIFLSPNCKFSLNGHVCTVYLPLYLS